MNEEQKDDYFKNWDEYFLWLAFAISLRSKDPSTKVGAVIVNEENRIISTGYNGFPRRMLDKEEWWNNRDEKYSRVVHAEINAIIHSKESVQSCTLYTWPFAPCNRCTSTVSNAGISRVVTAAPFTEHPRWGKELRESVKRLDEMGILVDFLYPETDSWRILMEEQLIKTLLLEDADDIPF